MKVIGRVAANSPESRGMGTTLTALAWLNSRVALAHIGDSRAYLMRDGKLSQLTRGPATSRAIWEPRTRTGPNRCLSRRSCRA